MALVFVSSEEIKQGLQGIFVAKHNWWKVAIKKLDTIANGCWAGWARKRGIKWLKIKLQYKILINPKAQYKTETDTKLQSKGRGYIL